MQSAIDRFLKLGGTFIVHGWSDAYRPGDELAILYDGVAQPTITLPAPNLSLDLVFRPGASDWGFRAVTLFAGAEAGAARKVGLRFANGEEIAQVAASTPQPLDEHAHGLFAEFAADVRRRGGRLLEIGARARSGGTVRELFGDQVEYIGLDVADGPNVSVVADAHHLSEAIADPVDFVCSVSTFEHLMMPWKAAIEINKVLKPGGRVFSHSHQAWPLHDEPFDYFRFSEEAWRALFNEHTGFRVLETRRGHMVQMSATYNMGPPFDTMEHSPAPGMTVCLAEKVSEPKVAWDRRMATIGPIEYTF